MTLEKRWLTLLKRFSLGYILVCLLLYYQQQRLIFFPSRHLENTPDLYQLNYQDVSIAITTTTGAKENIHGWWIPATNSDAPVILYFHHNAVNIGANVSQAKQFHKSILR